MIRLAGRIPNGIHEAQNAPRSNRRVEREKGQAGDYNASHSLYVPLPGFGLLFDDQWMQNGCRVDANLTAHRHHGCTLGAKWLHSGCIPSTSVQIGCKPVAHWMQT
jgi:hypothetical protein